MVSSRTAVLNIAAYGFAAIFTLFGLRAFLQPTYALEFFELSAPATAADRRILNTLLHIYGAREIFKGVAIWAAALVGTQKSLAMTLIAAGGVAFVDGVACFSHEQGHWNHWLYAPVIWSVGVLLL
ncbi:hypothetical protein PG985_003775 [Apiospora marii]|uniref:Integral membrane protein n=1 Tax=Apiospora marii TaxID=335849 RepID=A0ABR1SJF7_9PEZI